ncbi:hypothetical protein NFHSH190041_33860 [Shewanella sp. NFH-SH190041]|uniref:hypothetical protein n=1 Tax=Shewanella sp. NFH-SH190041 TaxID=2950245 RepID=UPI0021C419B7|nr:hypothetical protein [Shewanella sp. NFH-SH190041]BDM65934.1 hypothetical protein NFHSH190041_33860 [Shewanella sp. NFH-SH190041]
MVRNIMLSGLTGVAIGYGAAWLGGTDEFSAPVAESDDAAKLTQLKNEIAMQQLENDLLVRMVKAGLRGDIADHMQTYRQLAHQRRPQPPVNTTDNSVTSPPSFTADTPTKKGQPKPDSVDAQALVARVQRADIALQKQALAEGWADAGQLNQARRELWQEAKNSLMEQQYMAGLHQAGLPNMLFLGSTKTKAAKALGLKYGDVLMTVAGQRVYSRDDLRLQLENLGVDSTLELTFNRQGLILPVTVTALNQSLTLYGDSVAPEALSHKRR